jgi:hypothetical protein
MSMNKGVNYMRFEVLTEVNNNRTVSWDVTQCSFVHRFELCIGICYFHLQSPDAVVVRAYLLLFSVTV